MTVLQASNSSAAGCAVERRQGDFQSQGLSNITVSVNVYAFNTSGFVMNGKANLVKSRLISDS